MNLELGDLIFPSESLGHVQIYIGGGKVIQEPQTGDVCKVSPLSTVYVARRILTSRTPIKNTSSSNVNLSNATEMSMEITAYTGAKNEGGNESASGKTLEHGMIASNVYPFGTKFYLIGINGLDDGIFEVQDRGGNEFNSSNRLDIYMGLGQNALTKAVLIGRQTIKAYKIN